MLLATHETPAGEPPSLFVTTEVDPKPSPSDGRFLQTATTVLDKEALRAPAQRLMLNLPGREPEIVELLHWEPRQGYIQILDPNDPTGLGTITIPDPSAGPEDFWWHWYGKSENYTVALTAVKGVVAGRVTGAVHRYAVDPREDGSWNRLGLVNSEFWRTHPERPGPKAQAASSTAPVRALPRPSVSVDDGAPGNTAESGWDWSCPGPVPDGQHVIDVLLLYTSGILSDYVTVTNVHAALEAALADANRSLRNSGILNVVFSPRGPELLPNPPVPPTYDEMLIEEALDTLTGIEQIDVEPFYLFPGNAYVLGRRNAQWADIVALARNDPEDLCGATYGNNVVFNNGHVTQPGPAFENLAYLVYDPGCSADQLNLAHELGHQLGLEHDPKNFEGAPFGYTTSCPWSYGHKRSFGDPTFRFRTVMAYWQDQNWQSGGPPSCGSASNCPQIDAYSTPLLEWSAALHPVGTVPGASPIGVASPSGSQKPANAVDTLQRIAPIVQDYRPRPNVIFANGFQ